MTRFFPPWSAAAERLYTHKIQARLPRDFPLPYFLLFAAAAAIFTFSSLKPSGDDIYYASIENILSLCLYRYLHWSPRFFIDALTMVFCKYSMGAFAVLNVAVLCTIPVSIYHICEKFVPAPLYGAVFLLVLTYGMTDMLSAGPVATSLNYIWPLACLLMAAAAGVRLLHGGHISKTAMAGLCLLALFGCNQEQTCLAAVATFLCLNIMHYLRQRKVNARLCILLAICGLSLASVLLSPANYERYSEEVLAWYPEYPSFSFFYKVYLGFISTTHRYFFEINLPFVSFALLMGMALYDRYGNSLRNWQIVFLFSPALMPAGIGLAMQYIGISPQYTYILDAGNYTLPKLYVFLFVSIMMAFAALYLVLLTFKDSGRLPHILFILGLGLVTRMMMSFSPTIFASLNRTFLIMDFSFILASAALIGLSPGLSPKRLTYILLPCALLQVASLFK